MVTRSTSRRRVLLSLVAYYNDGSESQTTFYSPMDELTCEGMLRTVIASLLQTPVDEGGAPSSFVSASPPLTKIECSFEIVEYSKAVPTPKQLRNAKLTFGDD